MEKIGSCMAYAALATVSAGFCFALYQTGLGAFLVKAFAILAGHVFA